MRLFPDLVGFLVFKAHLNLETYLVEASLQPSSVWSAQPPGSFSKYHQLTNIITVLAILRNLNMNYIYLPFSIFITVVLKDIKFLM